MDFNTSRGSVPAAAVASTSYSHSESQQQQRGGSNSGYRYTGIDLAQASTSEDVEAAAAAAKGGRKAQTMYVALEVKSSMVLDGMQACIKHTWHTGLMFYELYFFLH